MLERKEERGLEIRRKIYIRVKLQVIRERVGGGWSSVARRERVAKWVAP